MYSKPIEHSTLTVGAAAVTLADGSPTLAAARLLHVGVNRCDVNVIDQPIRYTKDGSTPTSTHGTKAIALEKFTLNGKELAAFKAIKEGATDAELELAYSAE